MSYIHMKYISVQGGDFNMQHFLNVRMVKGNLVPILEHYSIF